MYPDSMVMALDGVLQRISPHFRVPQPLRAHESLFLVSLPVDATKGGFDVNR